MNSLQAGAPLSALPVPATVRKFVGLGGAVVSQGSRQARVSRP
ncbi:hypothetical protein AB0M39_27700 [Streptomyces sp. NPDC051907]